MPRTLPIPALLVCLGLAGAATAEARVDETDATPRFRAVARTVGEGTRPSALDPVQGLHASALPVARFGFGVFAEGFGYALTRRQALYDVEGGASWRIDDHVLLTASYRMLGFDLGYDSDLEGADFEPGIAAPFVGLSFDF